MKVLVACEFSGTVRDAFTAAGHDAWSCDLIPSETEGQHLVDDVKNVLHLGWDLMIAHPPCTYLANAGNRWLDVKSGRRDRRLDAARFIVRLWEAPIPRVAIENPISIMSSAWQPPTQVIHPYQFGHHEQKTIWLWLRGLRPLTPTNVKYLDRYDHIMAMSPSEDRQRNRSRFFPGIARAMAEQWGGVTCLV